MRKESRGCLAEERVQWRGMVGCPSEQIGKGEHLARKVFRRWVQGEHYVVEMRQRRGKKIWETRVHKEIYLLEMDQGCE